MRIDCRGLPCGVPEGRCAALSTSGLHRRRHGQHGKAHGAARGNHSLPESGRDEAMAYRAILRHPCRECGGMCLAWYMLGPPPSKSVGQKSLRTTRAPWKERHAEEHDHLSCSRDEHLTRNLRLPAISTTLGTFSTEHTTSETICGKAPSQRPIELPRPLSRRARLP